MRTGLRKSIIALVLAASSPIFLFSPATAGDIGADPAKLRFMALKQIRDEMVLAKNGDESMIKQIDKVANAVEKAIRERQRAAKKLGIIVPILPTNPKQMLALSKDLTKSLGANPYTPNESGTKERSAMSNDSSTNKNERSTDPNDRSMNPTERLQVFYNPKLTSNQVTQYRKQMPENWHAEPGQIQVVHNGIDTAIVWGADSGRNPVYDRNNNRFKIVSLRLAQ